jgi:hypothetical protein
MYDNMHGEIKAYKFIAGKPKEKDYLGKLTKNRDQWRALENRVTEIPIPS